MSKIKAQTMWVALGIVAILALLTLVMVFQSAVTGKIYYRTPLEACTTYTSMCEDGLPPIPTGNTNTRAQLVECRCQTNPYITGWRSLVLNYGKVA